MALLNPGTFQDRISLHQRCLPQLPRYPGTPTPPHLTNRAQGFAPPSSPPRRSVSDVEDTFIYNFKLVGGSEGGGALREGGRLQHSFRACGFLGP